MSAPNRNSALTAFYVTGGLREVIPIYPLYAIMFGAHGISPFELSLLFFLWALVGLITEVPSGAWADTFSRKWLVVAAGLFKSLAFLSWFLWQNFTGYALGFALWGFGSSLRSGAFEALLHDLLTEWDVRSKFTRHYGRIKSLATLSVVVGEILGGLLIIHGYDLVLIVSMIVPIIATIPFIVCVPDAKKKGAIADTDYLAHLKAGMVEAISNKTILFILLATSFLLIAYGIFDEYVPPLMLEKGIALSMIAFFAAPIYLAQSLGEFMAERFKWLSLDQLLILMIFACGTLLSLNWLSGYAVPAIIALFFFIFGLSSTLFASLLQHKIEGVSRATITSIIGFGDSIGAMIGFLIFGLMAEASSLTLATIGFMLLTMFLCLIARKLVVLWRI